MAEFHAGFFGSLAVAVNVAYIDRVLQMIPVSDKTDIGTFGKAGAAGAFRIGNAVGKAGFLQKEFNLA